MKKSIKNLLFNFTFAAIALIIVILFYKNILLTTTLLIILSIIILIKWRSKRTLIIFFVFGILCAIAEMIAIYYGVWEYALTNFFNIPFWLFILWGDAAALIYQIALEIKNLRIKD